MHIVQSLDAKSHQASPQRIHETASIVMWCAIFLCYLAVQHGRIATPEDFEQWDLGLQAAKTMLRCLHVTVVKLWGMRHNHLILSHQVDTDFIAQLEASRELQMAQTATHMKSMTANLGMRCLATAVAAPDGVKLVKCPAAHADRAPVEATMHQALIRRLNPKP